MKALARWLALVKFSHSIFALPFALLSAFLASGGPPPARVLLWVVVCAVAARTAAMGFNRLVDRRIDAENPRTAGRELPSGVLSSASVAWLVAASAAAFVAGAFALNPLCGWLAPPVLGLLLGYSFVKRVSALSHVALGLCLACAPLGAWVAVTGSLAGDLSVPLLLGAAVCLWVAGFDLIYACQDADFDRRAGLHSLPARLGVGRSLRLSSALHGATLVVLLFFAARAGLGPVFGVALVVAAALLVWQHAIVSADDLSRVDVAFFTLNGWVGVGLFAGGALDLLARGGVG